MLAVARPSCFRWCWIISLVDDGSEAGGGKVETLGEAYDRGSDSLENKIDNHIVSRADSAPMLRGGASGGGGGSQKRRAAAPRSGSQPATPPKRTKAAVRHHPRLPEWDRMAEWDRMGASPVRRRRMTLVGEVTCVLGARGPMSTGTLASNRPRRT